MMKALLVERVGGPEDMRIVEMPVPEPGPGEVRIKVAYAAVVPFDVAVRSGRMTWNSPALPYVMGTEYCGIIDKVGEAVSPDRIGARAIGRKQWGGMAEYAVAPDDGWVPATPGVPMPLAMVYLSSCTAAWHAIHTTGRSVGEGDTVLLHSAAGPVAIMAAQIAAELGAKVIGLAGGDRKVAFASGFGFDHVIDYRAHADWPEQVKALTGGKGVNLVIDGVQGPDAHRNLDALAPFGRIVFLGQSAGSGPPIPIGRLIAQSASVSGMVVQQAMAATGESEHAEIAQKIASGAWRYPLTEPIPFDRVIEAYTAFENRELFGRTVIAIDPTAV